MMKFAATIAVLALTAFVAIRISGGSISTAQDNLTAKATTAGHAAKGGVNTFAKMVDSKTK